MMKEAAISLAVKNMMKRGYFDICTIRELCSALDISGYQDNPSYRFMNLAHCLKFEELNSDEIQNLDYHFRSLFDISSSVLLDESVARA